MRVLLVIVLVALAIAASQTRVFTDGADIVTAISLGAFVALSISHRRSVRACTTGVVALDAPRVSVPSGLAWSALAAMAIGFELFNFAESPRHAHPTVSSALTLIATHSWSRGLAFAAWLALGIWIACS